MNGSDDLEREEGQWVPRQRIGAEAVVEQVDSSRHGIVSLPNGKKVIGFVDERDHDEQIQLRPGLRVTVKLNPYDMSRARIVGLAGD